MSNYSERQALGYDSYGYEATSYAVAAVARSRKWSYSPGGAGLLPNSVNGNENAIYFSF